MNPQNPHKCAHCEIDPHTGTIRPAVQQLLGTWLCQIHLDNAVTVCGFLLGPETARMMDLRTR